MMNLALSSEVEIETPTGFDANQFAIEFRFIIDVKMTEDR